MQHPTSGSLNCKHLRQNVLGLFKIRAQLLHVVHSPIYCFPDQMIFQFLRSDKQFFSSSLCAGLTHWLEFFPSNSSHAGLGPPHHAFSPSTLCPPAFLSMNTLSLRARTPSERGDWGLKKAQGFFSSWHLHLIYRHSLEPTDLIKGFLTVFDKLQEINVMVYFAHTSLPFSLF